MDWKKLSGSKKFKLAAAGAGGLVTLGGAAAAVAASLSPSNNVINACFDRRNGDLRLVDAGVSCHKGESPIAWNQQGPIGPIGPVGATGATGATGKDGRDGLAGPAGPAGATGAQGPQGVQGPQGFTGPQGPAGPAGSGGSGLPVDPCNGSGGVAYVAGSTPRYDIFLKLDDIQGESQDSKHRGEIDVTSFSWGGIVNTVSRVGTGGGSVAGQSKPCPVAVIKAFTDRSTPSILKAAATGEVFKEVTFSLVKNGGFGEFTFAQYKFSDVIVTSGGDTFGFVFQKVEVVYTPQKADGSPDVSVIFNFDFNSKI